jgi:Ca-activated chloride channel homolog
VCGGAMSFQTPWLLFSLVGLAAAVGLWLLAERRRQRYAVRFTNMDVLATVVSGRSWPRLVPPSLFALALAFLLVGLARPHVERTFLKERATVILVVDTSRSMQAEDVDPTRLGAAQEALRDFLDDVPDRLNVGLVVFAGEAQVATPPTKDHELVRTAVDEIDSFLIYGGTAIGDALEMAVEQGKRATDEEPIPGQEIAAGDPSGTATLVQATSCGEESPASILFLSDGAQTRGTLEPLQGADRAKEAGIPVYTVALGTPNGTLQFRFGGGGGGGGFGGGAPSPFGGPGGRRVPVPPDPETLRAIANRTGGEFFAARDAKSLRSAYAKLGSRLGRRPGRSEITYGFLAAAAGLLLAAGLLSALWSPRLP